MLARKSTHKRKRSSKRADARSIGGRCVATLHPSGFGSEALEALDEFPFVCSFEAIMPNPPPLPSLQAGAYYTAKVPLTLFLDPLFVGGYVKCGLTALSRTRLDDEDTFCLDGQGTLVLALTKDTYQTLGLTGRASHFSRMSSGRAGDRTSGAPTRYIVELPLASPSFVPGKKGYQQALDRLTKLAWKGDVLFAFDGGEINFPQHLMEPSCVTRLENAVERKRIKDVWVPDPSECWADRAQDVLEWAALVGMDAHAVKTWTRPDSTCVYQPPKPCAPGQAELLRWTGFVTSKAAKQIINAIKQSLGQAGWAYFAAAGFADAPVAWKSNSPLSERYGAPPPESTPEQDEAEANATSARRKRSRQTKRRSQITKGTSEHAFSPSGWSCLLLPSSRTILVEHIGTDTRS